MTIGYQLALAALCLAPGAVLRPDRDIVDCSVAFRITAVYGVLASVVALVVLVCRLVYYYQGTDIM